MLLFCVESDAEKHASRVRVAARLNGAGQIRQGQQSPRAGRRLLGELVQKLVYGSVLLLCLPAFCLAERILEPFEKQPRRHAERQHQKQARLYMAVDRDAVRIVQVRLFQRRADAQRCPRRLRHAARTQVPRAQRACRLIHRARHDARIRPEAQLFPHVRQELR